MIKVFVFSFAGLALSAPYVYAQAAPQSQALAKDDLVRVCPPSLTANQIKTLQGDETSSSYGNNINFFSSITVPQLQAAGLLPEGIHGVAGGSLLEFTRDPKTTGSIVGGRGFTWSSVQSGKTKIERADAVIEDGKLACVYRYKRSYLGGDASFKIYLAGKDRHAE
ncbi:MAG: hypothetical protein C0514_00170 [Candidatus Puniceispirillum sp.]|nr:hypothetical protein [Candidatus Puniceispirillum sp.]